MLISNIDSFFFSIDIEDYSTQNHEFLQYLEEAKEEAKIDRLKEITIGFGGRRFKIMPNGSRFHSYILHNDNLEIKLARHRSKSKNNFPIAVRLKSLYLWEKGFLNAYMETMDFLENNMKGKIIDNKVSRADLCCHTDELFLTSNLEVWRGRFRKIEVFTYNRCINGFTFGSFAEKNIMCRIYDKTLEIKSSGKEWFKEIWNRVGMNLNNVWNVEFQVGRKYFKEHQIESSQDFILKMRGIWEKLTKTWINYIELDNERKSRCTVREEWLNIQNAYLDFCLQEPIKRETQKNYDAQRLVPQLVGILTSYGACKQKIVLDRVINDFKEDIEKYLKEKKGNIPIEKVFYDKLEYLYG